MPADKVSETSRVAGLVRHFEVLYREHMRELPIVNRRLQVEAVGFRKFQGHRLGVLITPWFMNLVLLPGTAKWREVQQGDTATLEFLSGPVEFTVSHDEEIGNYLTAVLFRHVAELPDQPAARRVAERLLAERFQSPRNKHKISRRELLTGFPRR